MTDWSLPELRLMLYRHDDKAGDVESSVSVCGGKEKKQEEKTENVLVLTFPVMRFNCLVGIYCCCVFKSKSIF